MFRTFIFSLFIRRTILLLLTGLYLAGCSSDGANSEIEEQVIDSSSEDNTTIQPEVDPFAFASGALLDSVVEVSCTLNDGSETSCYEFVIVGAPSTHEVGSFCPVDIFASADEVGIWFDGDGEVYDIDGQFIQNLPTLYNDSNWQLYDPDTGLVNVTDTLEKCDGAARPNVAAELQNHCVECSLDYVDGGISQTYTIPIQPVLAESPTSIGRDDVGLSLNGVAIAPPAPVDAILGAYTIAAFDDCAGHINPVAGYHYHGSAGCSEIEAESDGHAAKMGYALDGFGIYGMLDQQGNESSDLDQCRGHTDDVRGYHYHAASVEENMFIGCYSGKLAN
ncbi:YHYH protein [Glaciecola petra]|uniref:YHYH protein n=1 Tax=Glaciecola petra TaxID=3075602 RepID=A0ABU2ZU82_9ALTE|nr:YHYH protein [Aestuariibacter sp. P117]MDT0595970.1 YHYH protein [Aestuariibacter sp. P117]